jgi:glycosyltransferase involved in cell wall biosynthesis
MSDELGLSESVVWMGVVAHNDIWALMNVADVFMITNDVTNRCNPLYEATWAGLPVVSIVDPSTADLLKDGRNALLADKDDADALGRNLAELCSNRALSKSLRRAQRKLASSFWTWEERMRIEVNELEKLVAAESDGV